MLPRWVVYTTGVPIAADFSAAGGRGAPLCVNSLTGDVYYLKANIPTLINQPASGASITPSSYGLIGDGASHPLNTVYATLAAAQAVYPFATALTQEIDYCAFKAASNAAFGADGVENAAANARLNKTLVLPGCSAWFGNDTWTIRNLVGGKIIGSGKLATKISGNGTVLAFDGLWFTEISYIDIETTGSFAGTQAAFEIDGNVPGHPYATRGVQGNRFTHLYIVAPLTINYGAAMTRLGNPPGPGAQGSENTFYDCHFQGSLEACYFQTGFNALANKFFGGNFQYYKKRAIQSVGAPVEVYGPGFQSIFPYDQYLAGAADIELGDSGANEGAIFMGCRTESLKFLRSAGAVRSHVAGCVGVLALAIWGATTAYGVAAAGGKIVQVPSLKRVFIATIEGTSGGVEPTWPTDGISTVADGTVVWQELLFDFIRVAVGYVDRTTCGSDAGRIAAPGVSPNRRITASTTMKVNETTLLVDATAGPVTVTLPRFAANVDVYAGHRVTIVKTDTTANAVTLAGDLPFVSGSTFNAAVSRTFEIGDSVAGTTSWIPVSTSGGVGAAPIGYALLTGGIVDQLTSKATALTLNKSNGLIRTNAAALAAATSVTFTFTNSTIETSDVIATSIRSGTVGSYFVGIENIAAGSCTVHLRNISGGSLSESVWINFALIKAVTS